MSSQKRKKKYRQQKRIFVGLIAFVIVGMLFCRWEDGRIADKGNLSASAKGAEKDGKATSKLKMQDVTDVSAQEPDDTKQEAADDQRSSFAVQPGVPVGTDVQTDEKVMYLTFDDGPSVNTQKILDILDRYDAKATFFVTNESPDYQDMIKKAYDKGNTIGLHTYCHVYQQVYSSVDAYFEDLDKIGQVVKQQIGYVPCFIRFPGGASNTISSNYTQGIMTALTQQVVEKGYQYYDWNAVSGDGGTCTAEEMVQKATGFSENNLILLCHDAAAKTSTVEALPKIMDYYKGQGYTFKAIDRESYVVHHGVSN